jgi:hypothetical protein
MLAQYMLKAGTLTWPGADWRVLLDQLAARLLLAYDFHRDGN